jgi:fibronectin type 3 domain-containing protein
LPGTGTVSTGTNPSSSQVAAAVVQSSTPQSTIPKSTTLHATTLPADLAATGVSSTQITLSWSAPTTNGGSPIIGYMIERSTNGDSTWSTIIANTYSTATTYSNFGLASSTTYTYRVSAINAVGTSSSSNTASATTLPASPAVPTGVTATMKSSSSITVSWTATTSATWYNVFSSTSPAGPFVNVMGTTATSFTNTGLSTGTTYYYEVRAWNTGGWSALSSPPVSAITGSVTISNPITPSVTKPITPSVTKPITPSVTKPITPSVTKPITPSVTKPIKSVSKHATPR